MGSETQEVRLDATTEIPVMNANAVASIAVPTEPTREAHVARAVADARERLSGHVLTTEGPRQWVCRRPPGDAAGGWSGRYWFRVAMLPGAILLYGDIGELLLRMQESDPLDWLRGAVKDPDYLLGKASAPRERVFLQQEAVAAIEELGKENPAARMRVLRDWHPSHHVESATQHEQDFRRAWYFSTGDIETPDCTTWSSQRIFQAEALRWLIEAVDAQQKAASTS